MKTSRLGRWQRNFYAGLAVVLPAVVTFAIVKWLFGTIANFTDLLLVFLPRPWTHQAGGSGPLYWYWSLFALVLAVGLITLIGRLARHYVGKKIIQTVETGILQVPLLNKIYGTIKQVNDAFSPGRRSGFKQVVLVRFPREGMYSVGFVTGLQHDEVQAKTAEKVVSVFVPTTPNPTTGFLILVPEEELIRLDMSVAEGIKFIISLGSISPEYKAPLAGPLGAPPLAEGAIRPPAAVAPSQWTSAPPA